MVDSLHCVLLFSCEAIGCCLTSAVWPLCRVEPVCGVPLLAGATLAQSWLWQRVGQGRGCGGHWPNAQPGYKYPRAASRCLLGPSPGGGSSPASPGGGGDQATAQTFPSAQTGQQPCCPLVGGGKVVTPSLGSWATRGALTWMSQGLGDRREGGGLGDSRERDRKE